MSLKDPAKNPAVVTAVNEQNADAFCVAILPYVSRTFALGIKVLPGALGQAVLDAYLLCRIVDTIEDAPDSNVERKSMLFDLFMAAFDDKFAREQLAVQAKSLSGEPAHLLLTHQCGMVFSHYDELPTASREVVKKWVLEMAEGMKKFVLLYPNGIRIQTLEEYREYCYYVAGTVGYMLTDLWHAHSPSIGRELHASLRERCREFAEALQTVNILKDVAADAEHENSIYVPEELLRAHGSSQSDLLSPEHLPRNREALSQLVQLAWNDLEIARDYLLLIPRRAIAIRMFCMLPLLLAYATLRNLVHSAEMLRPGGSTKISRREVRSLLVATWMLVASNRAVRWLVDRVRRKAFVPGFASIGG